MAMITTPHEKLYPKIRVTLLFGSIGFCIGSILGLFNFFQQQKALYELEHYGKLLQRDTISYEFAFLAPVVVIGIYGMLVGGILAYQCTIWRKRYVDKIVYWRFFLGNYSSKLGFLGLFSNY